ncbi:MAG: hypothetical protein ABIP79_00455 [Chitinophagaceae bacterium]
MFNLFKKKSERAKVTDIVFISTAEKHKVMLEDWKKDQSITYIFWFEDSLNEALSFFSASAAEEITLLLVRQTSSPQLSGKIPVFAEHHPLETKEQDFYRKMNMNQVKVYSALNEPLYKHFGAEKIIDLMRKLGIKENEAIEHKMISSSIKKAQNEIQKNVVVEQTAHSQSDWLQKNYKP